MEMSSVAHEYLRNSHKALKIAETVKFNKTALNYQLKSAESYWHMFLKSTNHSRFQENMNNFRRMVREQDISGALKIISGYYK